MNEPEVFHTTVEEFYPDGPQTPQDVATILAFDAGLRYLDRPWTHEAAQGYLVLVSTPGGTAAFGPYPDMEAAVGAGTSFVADGLARWAAGNVEVRVSPAVPLLPPGALAGDEDDAAR